MKQHTSLIHEMFLYFSFISKGQILQKTLEVDDIYGTVLYLASDQSKFVTGQTLMVDGGSVLL